MLESFYSTRVEIFSVATRNAATTATDDQPSSSTAKPSPTFQYPKSEVLFNKIITNLTRDDLHRLSDVIADILKRPLQPREFGFDGFGNHSRRRRRGGKAGGAGGGEGDEDAAAAAPAKPTTVDIKLVGFDDASKIKVIKEVRAIAGLGLKEAKELVEGAPKVISKDIKPEQAEELKQKLEQAGAKIELV